MRSVTTPSDDKMIRAQVFDQCRWRDICCNELGISGPIESENDLDDIQKASTKRNCSPILRENHKIFTFKVYLFFSQS